MAVAMAGMLVARLRIVPAAAWEAYMLLPAPLPGRAAAVGVAALNPPAAGSRFSFLAPVMAVFMFGYVVRVADGLTLRTFAMGVTMGYLLILVLQGHWLRPRSASARPGH